jgi:hypothetical protein
MTNAAVVCLLLDRLLTGQCLFTIKIDTARYSQCNVVSCTCHITQPALLLSTGCIGQADAPIMTLEIVIRVAPLAVRT